MNPEERQRRMIACLVGMIDEASTVLARLVREGQLDVLDERDLASLAEYAGMAHDAHHGRTPLDKGATTPKARKAFGYGGRGR